MNYSKVVLVGRLTNAPTLKEVGQYTIASFTIVVNDSKKKGHFIDCKAWSEVAHKAASFTKGALVIAEGALIQESWTDKETGKQRSKLVVNVSDIDMHSNGLQQEIVTPVDARRKQPKEINDINDLPF